MADGVKGLLAIVLLAVPGAYLALATTASSYTAEGTLWIQQESGSGMVEVVAIRPEAPNAANPWVELLRSYQVLDQVVLDERLHLESPNRSVRDASRELSSRLETRVDRAGSFLSLRLSDSDPQKAADVLNAVMERHVELAAELKSGRLDETQEILEEQLRYTEAELTDAERRLEQFRMMTISLPSDRSAPARMSTQAPRVVEEQRLIRRVQSVETLYAELRRRVETARVSTASATPDVRILDRARVVDRSSGLGRLGIGAGVVFGLVLAVMGGTLVLARRQATSASMGLGPTAMRLSEDLGPLLAIIAGGLMALLLTRLLGA